MHLKSEPLSKIPGIVHGFGSRSEPIPETMRARWEKLRPQWKQVHGIRCAEIEKAAEACGEADALFTFQSGLIAAVVTADCVPVLFARKDGKAVAAVHAGWRGTRSRITQELARILIARGEDLADWVAAVGPSIGPCCYEVSEELARDFESEFGPSAVPSYRHLDLPLVNQKELARLGFGQVDLLRACTFCSGGADPLFHSYRREGGGTRQYSMISGTSEAGAGA